MKTSQNGINLIKQYEGCQLTSYKCPAGVWTIGYGHTVDVRADQTITQIQAEEYLVEDLCKYEGYVRNNAKTVLNQNQFDALVSFAYNCGLGSLKRLLLNGGNDEIANYILFYNKAGGKVLNGLTRRRRAEQALFLRGISPLDRKYYQKCDTTHTGIVRALQSIGEDSSYLKRCEIATRNNIVSYEGSAEQNLRLLELLKNGGLQKV